MRKHLAHYPSLIIMVVGNNFECAGCHVIYQFTDSILDERGPVRYLEHCPSCCLDGTIYCPIAEAANLVIKKYPCIMDDCSRLAVAKDMFCRFHNEEIRQSIIPKLKPEPINLSFRIPLCLGFDLDTGEFEIILLELGSSTEDFTAPLTLAFNSFTGDFDAPSFGMRRRSDETSQ